MKYDVIIIGSGLGGLQCGYILARQGKRVLVLEQAIQAGGCLQSYRRQGLAFDTGFHYVGGLEEGQSLHSAFKYMGLLSLPWHQLDKDCFDRVTICDRSFDLAQGYEYFCNKLADDFPDERIGLMHYTKQLQDSMTDQLQPFSPDMPQPEYMGSLMTTGAWQFLEDTFQDPLLRNVLSGTSLKMELQRDTLPLFSFLHGNSSFVESSWRLQGDASQIVDHLASEIKSMGGEIICRAKVTELVEKDGTLRYAVCDNGETYEADIFISDIHPAQTCDLVKESTKIKKIFRNRMKAMPNTFGMFTVALTYKPQTVRYFNHNHYIYNNPDVWEHQKDGILVSCRVPEDGSEYTRQIDLLMPQDWSQCEAWQGTRVGSRGEDYEETKARLAEKCIDRVAQYIPEIKAYDKCYTSTPLTWHDYTLTPEGSAYGMRKDWHNPLLTMISPRTPVANLYMTGQNLMLHGVHGVTMTSMHTCAAILGKQQIWKILTT